MYTGLGWRSLNPAEAVADVCKLDRKHLLQVAHEARCAEARRLAVIRIGDKNLIKHFAVSDPSPVVRRRLVRELEDRELIRRIAESDPDASVRMSAKACLRESER